MAAHDTCWGWGRRDLPAAVKIHTPLNLPNKRWQVAGVHLQHSADNACRYGACLKVGGQTAYGSGARRCEHAAGLGINTKAAHALAGLQLDPALPLLTKDQVAHRKAQRCSAPNEANATAGAAAGDGTRRQTRALMEVAERDICSTTSCVRFLCSAQKCCTTVPQVPQGLLVQRDGRREANKGVIACS